MIDLNLWIDRYVDALNTSFGGRIWFVGLQGSHGRGEATSESDIDMVVILDSVSVDDIRKYNDMLDTLEHRELACGFLSGKEELSKWDRSDLFQFCHDTVPIVGSLDSILDLVDADAVERVIKSGACNVYHGCIHNMLYDKDDTILKELYKTATFAIRAQVYSRIGFFPRLLDELIDRTAGIARDIATSYNDMRCGNTVSFDLLSERLFYWAKSVISEDYQAKSVISEDYQAKSVITSE